MSVVCRIIEGGLCEYTQFYNPGVHNGLDVVGAGYTLAWITAHSDGTVVAVRNDCNWFESGSYGNYVKIKHDNGYYTLYGHGAYNTVQVNVGDRVRSGQNIMYMGNTGESYGGHLHWEVRDKNDVRIDPTPYLDADLPREIELPKPVERNKDFDQLEVTEPQLNVRLDHTTSAQSIGFCPVGIYNIVSIYNGGDYIWYEIEKGKWVANDGTWCKILPAEKDEIVITKEKYNELCDKFWEYLKENI